MLDTLTTLITTYGPLIVALFVLLESAGLPLPGETALLVAAAAAGTGQLPIGVVIAVAAGAAIAGDAGGYWLGRRGGRPFLERHGRWLHLDATKLERLEAFFSRHGPKAVFFGRFVGVLRTYAALFAGVSRMPYRTFTLFNALGGVTWAVLFGGIGYLFGQNLDAVERVVRAVGWALLIGIGLVVATLLVWRWIGGHQALLIARMHGFRSSPPIARLRVSYGRQLEWLLQRLTPGQYLGLHVTLGLLTAAGGLWFFGGIVQDIIAQDPLVQFDQALATMLHSWATPLATTVFAVITTLGSFVVVALGLLVSVFYAWRRQWLHLAAWLIALGGGEALNLVLKQLLARPRPSFAHPSLPGVGYSFPSGHAMAALIAYGMLTYFAILAVGTWRVRTGLACGAALLVLLIGFSRLYLGVHYFSDVIGGYAAGGVWLSTCITGMELVRRGEVGESWRKHWERRSKCGVPV
jgi:undecaprenyl-diphosphatase